MAKRDNKPRDIAVRSSEGGLTAKAWYYRGKGTDDIVIRVHDQSGAYQGTLQIKHYHPRT